MPPRPHECDPTSGVIDVGYLRPGEEREATELLAAVAAEGRWIGTELPVDLEARTAGVVGAIAIGQQTVIVARANERIVGTLALFRAPHGGAETRWLGLMVAAAWRGGGIGSALLRFAIAHARQIGLTALGLDVFVHNKSARALYRRFGFLEGEVLKEHVVRADGTRWDVIRCRLPLARSLGESAQKSGDTPSMNDHDIEIKIEKLAEEEQLILQAGSGKATHERDRLETIRLEREQLWDLLRQRRAKEEFNQNPAETELRKVRVVENYVE